MIKKLFFLAALLAPGLALGANPGANFSVQVVPAGSPSPGPTNVPAGYILDASMSDEFNGTALDMTKWHLGVPEHRVTIHALSMTRIMAQRVGVVAVLVPSGDHQRAEPDDFRQTMHDPLRPARVHQAVSQSVRQAQPALDFAQRQQTTFHDSRPPSKRATTALP